MTDIRPYKAKVKHAFLRSIKTIVSRPDHTPLACKIDVQDACSPLNPSFNFAYMADKKQSTHVAIVLFQNGTTDHDNQYVVLRSLKDNQKLLLHAPVEAFPKRRQFLKLECAAYTR